MFCWHLLWNMMWFWHKSLFLTSLYANLATKSLLHSYTQSWGTVSSQTSHKSVWFYLVPFSSLFFPPFFPFFLPEIQLCCHSVDTTVVTLPPIIINASSIPGCHWSPNLQSVLNRRRFSVWVQGFCVEHFLAFQTVSYSFRLIPLFSHIKAGVLPPGIDWCRMCLCLF